MGGVSFGATLDAMERSTGRPLIWGSGQFVSPSGEGDVLTIDVEILAEGGSVTQAQAQLRADDRLVLSVMGAFGHRAGYPETQFGVMPDVPPPAECPVHTEVIPPGPDQRRHFERRVVSPGRHDDEGRNCQWFRSTNGEPVSAGYLAIVADFFAGGHPMSAGASSLDNMLRIHSLKQTGWILAQTHLSAFSSGIVHGDMRLFAQDGTLLATAGQSGTLPRRVRLEG